EADFAVDRPDETLDRTRLSGRRGVGGRLLPAPLRRPLQRADEAGGAWFGEPQNPGLSTVLSVVRRKVQRAMDEREISGIGAFTAGLDVGNQGSALGGAIALP